MDTRSFENCDNCGGSGNESEYESEYTRCRACDGRGYTKGEKNGTSSKGISVVFDADLVGDNDKQHRRT